MICFTDYAPFTEKEASKKVVVAGALGECVHVAGVMNFLRLAEEAGWQTVFLGPAVSVDQVLQAARNHQTTLSGVSYRLTPETGERLLAEFAEAADDLARAGVRFAFGGTPPMAERARAFEGFFDVIFDSAETPDDVLAYLRGSSAPKFASDYPQTLLERIAWKSPYPLLRHHFGLPTLAAARDGIERIAEARALDVISLGWIRMHKRISFIPNAKIPDGRGRAAYRCARPMTTDCSTPPAGAATSRSCAPIRAPMTSSGWPRSMWTRSTWHGRRFPFWVQSDGWTRPP